MFFYVEICSKSKISLKQFLEFILRIQSPNLVISSFPKQKIKKFVTVLKSPHVNKTAQEQFEFRVHTKKLRIKSFQFLKLFSILKMVKNLSFPGINLKIKSVFQKKKEIKYISTSMNPKNVNLAFFESTLDNTVSTTRFWKIKKYINILDSYGECSVKLIS